MCLFCEIRAELERAGKGETGIVEPPVEAAASLESEMDRAGINAVNADSVLKLAKAAQILDNIHQSDAVKRVIGLIEQLVPAEPETELPPAVETAQGSDQELPEELAKELVEIARLLGVKPEEIQVARFPKV